MDRNLAVVREWEHLCNTCRNLLFDTQYAAECRVVYGGVLEIQRPRGAACVSSASGRTRSSSRAVSETRSRDR